MQHNQVAAARSAADLPEWVDRGVLIYGPKKGGTTLFQNLLDGSERLLVYPTELKLNRFFRRPDRLRTIAAYLDNSWVPGVETELLSKPRYMELWAQAIRRQELKGLAELTRYDAFAVAQSRAGSAQAYDMWCTKEVGGKTEKVLDTWREMYPEGKAILVLREPAMVTRALLNDRRRKNIRPSLRKIVEYTLNPLRVVKTQAKRLGDGDTLGVAYEDVVADTPGAMARVARFLDIPYDPVLERPTIFGEPVVVRTSSKQTTSVFKSKTSWRQGLTLREIAIVSLARAYARLRPRYRIDYAALRASLHF